MKLRTKEILVFTRDFQVPHEYQDVKSPILTRGVRAFFADPIPGRACGQSAPNQSDADAGRAVSVTFPRSILKTTILRGLLALLAIFALGSNWAQAAVLIDLVDVGNAGNVADTTGYGAVSYDYSIGKYDVTIGQYTAFLNAVAATDTYGLYNAAMATDMYVAGIARSGNSGSYTYSIINNSGDSANRPITYVSWFDAARFANWMANGQTTGAQTATTTEKGAYTLNGATSGVGFTKSMINPNTGGAVNWWIPGENEWYKAAYYSPALNAGAGGYWLYPTQSNAAPGNQGVAANQANYVCNGVFSVTQGSSYIPGQNYLTDVGAFSGSGSFFGTYDQGGDVWQWNDTANGPLMVRRGGSWYDAASYLQSTGRELLGPTNEYNAIGFRVAGIPEPSTYALLTLGVALIVVVRRQWGKRRQPI